MVDCCGGGGSGGGRPPPQRLGAARLAGRPLLSLGVLQLLLGLGAVALSCGALSLSDSQPVRRACPLWAGSSVILSGIIGLTTWRRPLLLLVNVFVLLSVMCVLLNLSAFILCCQGAQLVSSMNSCTLSETGDVCHCCSLSLASECPEDELLLLSAGSSCSTMRMLLKKVLFGLSALNALSTAVCLVAAGLRYLQIFNTRPPWTTEESGVTIEDGTEPDALPDPDEFVAPAPPPSYFSMFYSYTPRLARRMFGDNAAIPQASGGVRMKGAELFPPSDPPPPYEEVAGSSSPNATTTVTQETELSTITCITPVNGPVSDACLQTVLEVSGGSLPPAPPKRQQQAGPGGQQGAVASLPPQRAPQIRRSNSDPLLTELTTKAVTPDGPHHARCVTADSATQTSQSTLLAAGPPASSHPRLPPGWRRGGGGGPAGNEEGGTGGGSGVVSVRLRPPRQQPRPSSMVDYQSYRHTQRLVSRFLEQQPACSAPYLQGLDPEVHRLVDSIRTVLQLDQEHMEEVLRSARYLEQAFTESEMTAAGGPGRANRQPIVGAVPPPPPPPPLRPAQTLPLPPRRKRAAGLLHLRSCGDLSSFTCSEEEEPPEPPRRATLRGRGPPPRSSTPGGPAPEWGVAAAVTLRPSSRRRELHDRPHSLIGIVRETIL